jgi:SagB-type dehydrogenase family enzyme
MVAGHTARLYHRLTSYEPEREWTVPVEHELVVQDFEPNDVTRWPAACKAYADDLPRVELPAEWPKIQTSATAVLAGTRPAAPRRLDLPALGRVLFLASGVVRVVERKDRPTLLLRAAGSAGARFPLEVYVAARNVDRLDDGVHWYDPVNHALLRIGPAPDGDSTAIIVTGVPWRTGWRYAERGFRHIYWDAGTMLAQALTLAESAGLQPRLWTTFPDREVGRLVGADGTNEWPVAIASLGDGNPAIKPSGDATAGEVDDAPFEFPLVTKVQRAGESHRLGAPWPIAPPLDSAPDSPDLDAVIRQRGSTRRMNRAATIPKALYDFAMAASLRGTRVSHFVAVHGVGDVEPGLYRWPDLDRPLRKGNLREEMTHACWDQELGGDAAFVVMGVADTETLSDHGYREAQLDAGMVEGRLHLAAYALGIGASGMTFLDSVVPDLLGEPLAALLFTCVGVPAYRNKRGGTAGKPVPVVVPTPKLRG